MLLLRPGPHPMRELTRQALRSGIPAATLGELLEGLIRGDQPEPDHRVLVAIDQLEELWTTCADEAERTSFLDTVADLVRDELSPVTVVLTVRPDFLANLAEHPRLVEPL